MSILKLNELKKYFDTQKGTVKAVDSVSLSIKEGETFGLVGESGSGKSTVAYTVIGSYPPTSGEILFEGKDISCECARRPQSVKKRLQIVFQDPGTSLNPARSVLQTLMVPLKSHKIGKNNKERVEKVVELLEMVHLPVDYMHKVPSMLSGGEKQIIGIARALASSPSFIILDEPTSALDVSVQAKIINMLKGFQESKNLAYLFITHDLSLMRNVASHVAIMYLGKLCEVASTADFFRSPKHPYTQLLLSSIPVMSESEELLKPKKVKSQGEIPSPINLPTGCGFHLRCHKKMDRCVIEDPGFKMTKQGHLVRCHLYE